MFISNAYAQSPFDGAGLSGGLGTFAPFILMLAVLYFLMIRPQQKRAKEQKTMLAALTKGDEIVTASGMLGKIVKVSDTYITIEVADGVEVIMQKPAVTTLLPKGTIKAL